MNTKHSNDCTRIFKRYDKNCPRCIELIHGSQARTGWQQAYYSQKKKDEENRSRWMDQHFASEQHKAEVVCTAFDW